MSARVSTPTAPLVRSKSVPQPITGITSVSLEKSFVQRSISHVDVRKDNNGTKRRASAELTESTQDGGPFNLFGFFPTSFSAMRREGEEEWRWLRGGEEEAEEGMGELDGERREEEGPLRGGGSAIFGKETSDAIKGEDKLGALLLALKDVNLFGGSTEESEAGTGQLLSPYAGDEVVDETSLYLAQRTRRERSDRAGVVWMGTED